MVTRPITATLYVTEEELLALPSDARVEVVDGEIVEMSPVGALHVFIVDNFYRLLYPIVSRKKLGYLFTDSLIYHLFRTGNRLLGSRVPDVSFVSKPNIPKEWNIEKPFPGAPTLAIEVMSPDDDPDEMLKKVREYLEAGTEQVWVTYARQREIHVYRRGIKEIQSYSGKDVIDVSDLFPGLSIALTDVFAIPELE